MGGSRGVKAGPVVAGVRVEEEVVAEGVAVRVGGASCINLLGGGRGVISVPHRRPCFKP